MRKTFLTMAFALLAFGTVTANEKVTNDYNVSTTTADKADGINSFCKAIVQGDLETVKKLIALGEDVNQKSLGKTPVIFAARYNRVEILQVLISNGADLGIKCDRGFSAKKYAKLSNATDALQIIEAALQS